MTFSFGVKEEILKTETENPCCLLAESYGLMLFGRGFSAKEVYITTENEQVAKRYQYLAERLTCSPCEVSKSSAGKYKVSIVEKENRLKALKAFGYEGNERTRRMNWANIQDECCVGAFLRGVFLACGTVNSPEKNYHLEFVVPHMNLSRDLQKFMTNVNLQPKTITRNGSYVLYFKDSSEIEDLLTVMGASGSALELMGVKMYKDVRNNVNRRTNFENANLDRTINAALTQIQAIEKLEKYGMLRELPEDLKQVAILRKENPEYSLAQIGKEFTPPLSRSGVNHRIKKLCAMADNLN